jgi:hypothetical protein
MIEKLHLYKKHKDEYVARKQPVLVKVGPANYLTIEGTGEPAGEVFQAKMQAMYSVAFTIKMTRKFAGKGDYKVCHLEGLWWAGRKGSDFMSIPRQQWRWKLMIRVPDFITERDLTGVKQALREKGKPPDFKQVKLEKMTEGRCVQMLHVGPYSEEPASVARMTEFAKTQGLKLHGLHHEIYLSDPRRVAPERLRTILRHPVQR